MASQPSQKSTGAVLVWVSVELGATPLFLGTCEQHPIMESEPNWEAVFNDFGGFMTAFDYNYQGAEEAIICEFQRWDERVLNIVNSAPNQLGPEGFDNKLSRGAFLNQNFQFLQVWFQYSFFGTINAQPDLEPGWFYPSVRVGGIFTPKQGTKGQNRRIIFAASNQFAIGGGDWNFTLKSNLPAAFVALNGLVPT